MSLYAGLLTSSARFDCGPPPPPALSAPIIWLLLLVPVPSWPATGDFLPFFCRPPEEEPSPPVLLFCESIVASSASSVDPVGPKRNTPAPPVADKFRELLLLLESAVSIGVTVDCFSSFASLAPASVAPRLLVGELLRLFSFRCSEEDPLVAIIASCCFGDSDCCIEESSSMPVNMTLPWA